MAWLGEELDDQRAATPFAPRCTKDLVEEALHERRRDLFTDLDLVFFDTTSCTSRATGVRRSGSTGTARTIGPT
jgi:hypothetical protein